MLILALDSALSRCSATLVADGHIVAAHQADPAQGHAAILAGMARDVLRDSACPATGLDLIAVTLGPGSFTGIRGGIALALGIGVAAGVPVVGVTMGEALAEALPFLGGRTLWTAVTSRRGRVFLEIKNDFLSVAVTGLPSPDGPVAVAGTAAMDVASRLAASGADVMLTDVRFPSGRHIASAGLRRHRGDSRPLPVQPVYVDAPEAKLPAPPLAAPP